MRCILAIALALALAVPVAVPAAAQDRERTLADIRQELSVLYVRIERLRRELSTTGAPETGAAGGSALERLDSIESALKRLTSDTERLQFRIDKLTREGTNRIGDLEFRLCELEADCDTADLGETPSLGGDAAGPRAPAPGEPAPQTESPELAVGEQADFDRAKKQLDAGDDDAAAAAFESFTETYPGGALAARAHFLRGTALSALGRTDAAARAYLESFSGAPDGAEAPKALYRLGLALDGLGERDAACKTLAQVAARFPDAAVAGDAGASRQEIGCAASPSQ